jgi:hypothetical protein
VKVRQYAYFTILGTHLSPEQIAHRVGVAPDRATHGCDYVCKDAGLTVEEQVNRILARLTSAQTEIADLVDAGDATTGLRVVRYFNAEDGEEEDLGPTVDGLEKLAGQHQLLGWNLRTETLAFLIAVGADLDVDEYG